MKVKNLSFTAVFIEDPEGGYSAFIEEIPGANSQGETLEEAKENVVEALHMVLETNKKNPHLITQTPHTKPIHPAFFRITNYGLRRNY